jgi:N-acetylglucosamine kinase-like BadF-type ATPase
VYVLGVDGGNTKTIALVARPDGTIVGGGRSGCSDIYAIPHGAAIDAIRAASLEAFAEAGIDPRAVRAGAFSLAGADWPEDFELYRGELDRQLALEMPAVVVNDAIGGLRAGSPDGVGVSVVCGTGAAIGARGPEGRIWHASFWLEPAGGVALGWQAVRAVTRSTLGLDPPSSLTSRLLEALGEASPDALLHRFTRRAEKAPQREVGRVARVLLDTAEEGDETARRLVVEHGGLLADYALVAARETGLTGAPFSLVFAGGLFRHHSDLLLETVTERVRSSEPGARPLRAELPPAAGALLLALEAFEEDPSPSVLERMLATLPPPAFFAT